MGFVPKLTVLYFIGISSWFSCFVVNACVFQAPEGATFCLTYLRIKKKGLNTWI